LLVSPVIIPNMTTRKWTYLEGSGQLIQKGLPDLMVVIDSSGSMGWDIEKKTMVGRYHIALLAAFAAVHYVIQKGSYVAGINFSSGVKVQSWTNNHRIIEKLLLSYQGGGTTLPHQHILKLAKGAQKHSLVILISDLEIDNWEVGLATFHELLQMGHKLIAFFIDGNPQILKSPDFRILQEMGARFYCVEKIEDLTGLVIQEIRENYNDNL
jgi:hypothetical protein